MEKKLESKRSLHLHQRVHFDALLLANPNYFGGLPNSEYKPVLALSNDIFYEEISTVGYNPETEMLEATIHIKHSVGVWRYAMFGRLI